MQEDLQAFDDMQYTNYRDIAAIMTEMGFEMKHSTVHNCILKIMNKFVVAIVKKYQLSADTISINDIVKNVAFQQSIADILHIIELDRRKMQMLKLDDKG